MGKTRDLFKKIRDTKGTFHAKMGSIKDRNGMDLETGVWGWGQREGPSGKRAVGTKGIALR